ncbi:MAG TPA: phosphatase PAP2 family protein [Pseudolabrys sp.]|nr:phosphatase PAP2 family protein [Pseudolabrys sp.]
MSDIAVGGQRRQSILTRLAILCFAYAAGAALIDVNLYVLNLAKYLPIFIGLVPLVCAVDLLSSAFISCPQSPLGYVRDALRERGTVAVGIAVTCWVGMAAFWTYKFHIPELMPFYADRVLANIDEAIHFGAPWRFLHRITPDAAVSAMVLIYFPAWVIQFVAVIVFASFHSNARNRTRYLVSFATVIAGLGTLLAGALSSVGPIYYDRFLGGTRFAGLTHALHANPDASPIVHVSELLYAAYVSGTGGLVAGISAMPSIHVAVPALNAIFLLTVNRWAGIAGCIFTATIMFESVYFGWHYALDGYVSVAAVLLIWYVAGLVTQNEY